MKGCETPGHVIVSAANAQVLSCNHVPIWKDNQLRSKTTWVGSVECMQVSSFILDFITVRVTFLSLTLKSFYYHGERREIYY